MAGFSEGMRAGATRATWLLLCVWPLALEAAPPRILDEAADQAQAAVFADEVASEPPRLLTPREKSDNAARKAATSERRASGQASLWGTVAGLFAVFGLFVGAKVWLTRHGPIGFRGLPVEALELLGRKTIEPRISIHIVRCGPKILVLGVSPDGVRTLTEITDPVEIDLMAGACRAKEAGCATQESFAGKIRTSTAPRRDGA
jgi:flagellar biogenesis protein FliO